MQIVNDIHVLRYRHCWKGSSDDWRYLVFPSKPDTLYVESFLKELREEYNWSDNHNKIEYDVLRWNELEVVERNQVRREMMKVVSNLRKLLREKIALRGFLGNLEV